VCPSSQPVSVCVSQYVCLSVCFVCPLSVCVSLIVNVSGSWRVCVSLSVCVCLSLYLRPSPICKVPSLRSGRQEVRPPNQVSSLRSGYEEVKPRTLGSSYPRAAKDRQQLQASLRSPPIGVQSPLSPPSGSST